ncbi:three-Cys-motif partner protein TcmP [Xanthomonas cerealis pv. cerealis]|uniref:three-Cys-motif partner protein TcmP n=1 Tax=Xanthomonas cerealis TaxID=3390025 RepID=UPI001F200110|nr:three-Cys-motif partner protein TcmP [Xanthomonas translucens]UKE68690.1 three-Cys-motif partner protein TcmP [Xanthomonas translucens pv. pistacia]
MTLAPYTWDDGVPATIQQHSIAKHEVLREYLVTYLQTLVTRPAQDALSVTLIDGFAGGGVYQHQDTKELVLGSPFIFLEAAREAEALIAIGRQKPLRWNLDYFFVEKNKKAHRHLKYALEERGYGSRIDKDIHLINDSFDKHASNLIQFVKQKSPIKGRSIFLLDQYGYAHVPASQIRGIFHTLPTAEVILTFAVDAFINFASDTEATRRILKRIDLPDVLKGRTLEDIKRVEKDFRLYIQSCFYKELVEQCGAKFFTVFFIRTTGHGDYWLVHLSQHPKARDVMTTVHWSKNNHFIHYGDAGLDMFRTLGYSTSADSRFTGQNELGFCFDANAGKASIDALVNQLSPLIHARPDGITFGELFTAHCNSSPADGQKYRLALERLIAHKEVTATSKDGARRFRASTITGGDLLKVSNQTVFSF